MQACLEQGATGAMWQKDHGVPPQGAVILVDDTLVALQALASAYLAEVRHLSLALQVAMVKLRPRIL